MIHTPKIRKALQFAARRHHGQFRRETEQLPYITHPVSVALLLAEADTDEDTIIAGLLHDTVEDTDTTPEELSMAFGPRVMELVLSVSEPKKDEHGNPLDWRGKKETYLLQLKTAEDAAVWVSIADKIDNIESKLEAFAHEGEALLERWTRAPEDYYWYHSSVYAEATSRGLKGPLMERLKRVLAEEYSTFIAE